MSERSRNITLETAPTALTDREKRILRLVVQSFIDTAGPVGSRYVARKSSLGLSPASIRNTMSDLEDQGYLDHPYTSAGRIPTELGYRTFVDQLMDSQELTTAEKKAIRKELEDLLGDTEKLLKESSKLLGRLTNLLGLVLSPRLSTGVLERLEVVPLSSSRVMFVVSVRGGLIRTIIMKLESELNRHDLEVIVAMLNERLAGLTLEEIRKTCAERVKDIDDNVTGIVELVMSEQTALFNEDVDASRLQYGDPGAVITQPEFSEPKDLRTFMELIEDRESLVDLIEGPIDMTERGRAQIRIGSAIGSKEGMSDYSMVTAHYALGQTVGTVGVLGPKRMDYGRVLALVEGMAALMSSPPDHVRH